MGNAAIVQELSELRAQVEELKKGQRNGDEHSDFGAGTTGEQELDPESELDSIKQLLSEKLVSGDVEAQIKEFIVTLEEEIKETRPMTVLGIFALGVLVGRLLPKRGYDDE